MNEPKPEFEKKVLRDVIEQYTDVEETSRKQTRLRKVIFGVASAGFIVAFFLAINEITHPVVVAFIAGMAGSSLGFGLFLDYAQKQWPVMKDHIDMNSVKKRLAVLDL